MENVAIGKPNITLNGAVSPFLLRSRGKAKQVVTNVNKRMIALIVNALINDPLVVSIIKIIADTTIETAGV